MFILKVTKLSDGSIQQSDFNTNQECVDHFEKYKAQGYWGKEEYTYNTPEQTIHHDEVLISPAIEAKEATQDVFNDKGELVSVGEPAVEAKEAVIQAAYDEVIPAFDTVVPCEYSYEILEVKEKLKDISPRQIRLGLLSLGINEALVDGEINGLGSPDKDMAYIAWKYSTKFERDVPMVTIIGNMLGLSEAQLDQLWIGASEL